MQFVDKYDVFLLDCDGVIWHGKDAIAGAADAISKLITMQKTVIFVTNNSTQTRSTLNARIKNVLGIDVEKDKLYSSGIATALYMKDKLKPDEKVYLIGSKAFSEVMDECGIKHIGCGLDMEPPLLEFPNFIPDPSVKFVVGGFDPYFNHTKMTKAFIYIRECNATYIATNLDTLYPINKNRILPGTGSVLAGLNHALGYLPTVIGKPTTVFYDVISKDHAITDKSKVLMIGDNLLTDIQFGHNSGIDTALVLTGIATKDMLDDLDVSQPTYVLNSIADIL